MTDEQLTSLYARLQEQRPDLAARTAPYRIARDLRADAEQLADGLHALRDAPGRQRRFAPAWGWALAASVVLAAVFSARQIGPGPAEPAGQPPPDRALMADAPAAEPLFSGSFERGNARPAETIFDSSFGS